MSSARAILPWLIPPALAIIAFAPVLGMWFVADDFAHLLFNERLPFPQPLLAFGDDALFYRPLSTALTWNLGTTLFGTNAFPYHAISLLAHALSAFLLARLGYVVSGSMPAGLLAGALFAVYPLTTEPVAWLAAQWDVLGAACVLGAALGFAVAWRDSLQGQPARLPYALGLLSAFLAVGMKESTLPLPAVLPFVALAVRRTTMDDGRWTMDDAREKQSIVHRPSSIVPKALAWSLPYAIPTLLFVGLRVVSNATIGGYREAPTDFQRFFWDALVTAFLSMLMPLNRLVFGDTVVQVVGMVMTMLVLGALIAWGRRRWPVLLLALAWWVAFLVPALNLIMVADRAANLQNRIYYLSLIGFCLALGSLLSIPLAGPRRRVMQTGWASVTLALLIAVLITWKQLEPWTQASRQTRHVVSELATMLPPRHEGQVEINARDLPLEYKGAYVFWNGLDSAVQVFHGQSAHVNGVDKLNTQALAEPLGNDAGRWHLDFTFNPNDQLFYVGGLAGVTKATEPPTVPGTRAWDFRACGGIPAGAQVTNADLECWEGYATVSARTSDPAITFSGVDLDLTGVRWVRLAASMQHPSLAAPHLGEWYWMGEGGAWSEQKSARFYVVTDEEWRVYWTYVSAADVGARLTNLRFDPVNDRVEAEIGWIAVTALGTDK
jgi:hypothetical protein